MLKTFVSNRVAEFQSLYFICQWRHVSSNNNPADVLSRGTDARDLRGNDFLRQGPELLLRDISDPEEYPCPNANVSDILDKLLNITNN
ncbi:hypothetical protein AVEN_202398-1 [Araneus ventricosus]|uniref:Uncharacterized protein n=1 Tax=Araneus ventricosus TaxID=182803 RepID=A0A4Y2J041_ARAVE|nr:hypothetical protein AVEN_202398-1 [Araneus ventricosus]